MHQVPANPCADCDITQLCCLRLKGLKVTESERMRHFVGYEDLLDLQTRGSVSIVSAKEGTGGCPHYDNGCTVYEERPIECRMFPWTIGAARLLLGRPFLTLHANTSCPAKSRLIIPYHEARELAAAFARDAFGDNSPIILRETLPYRIANAVRRAARKALGGNSRT